jgi:hypothetical protein
MTLPIPETAPATPVPDDAPPGEPAEAAGTDPSTAPGTALEPADERQMLHALIVQAHPDVVPELVRGETLADMLASVPDARAAFARVLEQAGSQPSVPASQQPLQPPQPIPAGGMVRSAVDAGATGPTGFDPLARIRAALDRERL